MCGIAGFLTLRPDGGLVAGLARALALLKHRGPDDGGSIMFPTESDRGPLVGLGNRRLSIVDPTRAGHQPMTTSDGRYSITYNGEIYNAPELRTELEASGHRFVSRCDTEVLVHAWAAWGPSCLGRLEGMFAFALLDRTEQRLVLARDAFGIKPLFYSRGRDRMVFASEISAVLGFGGVGRAVNTERLRDYLIESRTGQGPETLLADIRQVPPAHCLDVPLDLSSTDEATRYWSPDPGARRDVTLATAAAELRALLLDSVRLHLRSDVPIGFSLSGGLDSSSVLVAARHVLGPRADLQAFGFAADEPAISETGWQRQAATAADARLHQVRIEAREVARDLDRIIDIQGEPFGSPTIYAQYRVFLRAREAGVTVMLGGQGSDELFAGYQAALPARVASLLTRGRWIAAARLVSRSTARTGLSRRGLARQAVALALPPAVEGSIRRRLGRPPNEAAPDWLDTTWLANQGVRPATPWRPQGLAPMRESLVHGIETTHLQALMRYEDRNAMALSLENRVPLLTQRLAHFAFSLPEALLVSPDGEHKAVLREAMRGMVPDTILDRPDTVRFAVPIVRWLRELAPLVEQRMAELRTCPAIRVPVLRAHWETVRSHPGRVGSAYAVWRCITLGTWATRAGVQWS